MPAWGTGTPSHADFFLFTMCNNKEPPILRRTTLFLILPKRQLPKASMTRARGGLPALRSGSLQGRDGGERDRTDDLRLAKPALSQLSYAP